MSIFVSCFLFGGRRKQKPFLGYHKTYYVCYWPKSCVICTAFWILRHWLWTWMIFYVLTHYPILFSFLKSSFQYIHCDIMKSLITTHLSRMINIPKQKYFFSYCICNLNTYKYKYFTCRNVHLKNNICTNSLRTWQQYLLAKSKSNTRGKPRKSIVWKSSLKLVWTQSA